MKSDNIFKVTETYSHNYYICKGSKGDIYNLTYDKFKDLYRCSCNNVRNSACKHIKDLRKLNYEQPNAN